MHNIDDCLQRRIEEDRFKFGISPLHEKIRFFDYLKHIAYRKDVKTWQVRGVQCKDQVEQQKTRIQEEFRSKLGLIIDKPRSGGSGNSNDGNTARTFFRNSDTAAEITGLKKELIDR